MNGLLSETSVSSPVPAASGLGRAFGFVTPVGLAAASALGNPVGIVSGAFFLSAALVFAVFEPVTGTPLFLSAVLALAAEIKTAASARKNADGRGLSFALTSYLICAAVCAASAVSYRFGWDLPARGLIPDELLSAAGGLAGSGYRFRMTAALSVLAVCLFNCAALAMLKRTLRKNVPHAKASFVSAVVSAAGAAAAAPILYELAVPLLDAGTKQPPAFYITELLPAVPALLGAAAGILNFARFLNIYLKVRKIGNAFRT